LRLEVWKFGRGAFRVRGVWDFWIFLECSGCLIFGLSDFEVGGLEVWTRGVQGEGCLGFLDLLECSGCLIFGLSDFEVGGLEVWTRGVQGEGCLGFLDVLDFRTLGSGGILDVDGSFGCGCGGIFGLLEFWMRTHDARNYTG
jgi:hypothetical protein